MRRRAAFAALLFALAGCGPATAEGPPPRPAMWALADDDTTIYLFGTVHMLPKDYRWRTKRFDDAVAKSQALVLEIVPEGNAQRHAEAMKRLAYSPGLPPLAERVPPEKRAALAELIKASRVPAERFDAMDTWAAALTLGAAGLRAANVTQEQGVELQLDADFRKAGKTVDALETTEGQLGLFDAMPEPVQRRFLVSILDDLGDSNANFKEMIKAWSSGDTDAIAKAFGDEDRLSPEIAAVLMTQRNANWANWLAKRLETPGTVLVAVGAGHFVGPDSVQGMLANRGLKVTRVQ